MVIWNLIRRCNLTCKHCYSISADTDFPGELSTAEVFTVMDDLKAFRVPVLILSGGEPLLRPDIFEISRARQGHGLLRRPVDQRHADRRAQHRPHRRHRLRLRRHQPRRASRATHDRFRRLDGAFDASLHGIRLCTQRGIKVGMRFTMTRDNAHELPALLDLMERGRHRQVLSLASQLRRARQRQPQGRRHARRPRAGPWTCCSTAAGQTRSAGGTGNSSPATTTPTAYTCCSGCASTFPNWKRHMRAKLAQWGGNSSGVNIANIDNLGNVHPDTMWWHYTPRQREASGRSRQIWPDTSDPLMAGLKASPRAVTGRCGACRYFDICGGNTRVRAHQLTGDPWAEDPACYLHDEEIGVAPGAARLEVTPYTRQRIVPISRSR
ncbi:MAG: radical SAM protein [Desulfosudis oleivorans]|nr:radical SAM protein [Desulfosudis oleivorans]